MNNTRHASARQPSGSAHPVSRIAVPDLRREAAGDSLGRWAGCGPPSARDTALSAPMCRSSPWWSAAWCRRASRAATNCPNPAISGVGVALKPLALLPTAHERAESAHLAQFVGGADWCLKAGKRAPCASTARPLALAAIARRPRPHGDNPPDT